MSDAGPPDPTPHPLGGPPPAAAPAPLYQCWVYPAGAAAPALASAVVPAPAPAPPTPFVRRGVPVWLLILALTLTPFVLRGAAALRPLIHLPDPVRPVLPTPVDPAVTPLPIPPPGPVPGPAPSDPALAQLATAAATYQAAFADAHAGIAGQIDNGQITNKGQLRDALVSARVLARSSFVAAFDARVDAHCDPNGVFTDRAAVAAAVRAVGSGLRGVMPKTGEPD